jgi:mannitol-specific phosphotransferase system IIBC component
LPPPAEEEISINLIVGVVILIVIILIITLIIIKCKKDTQDLTQVENKADYEDLELQKKADVSEVQIIEGQLESERIAILEDYQGQILVAVLSCLQND